ncbi:L(+)-tartrate dehydratase subunit alpha [Clostridium sp. HV4-5-A1G]|uniref:L(+)-tartrate dehydratase subunit alpha n=1 Tax=Clostridium sp. HV4-5-A1G TaxID=2004595 RepID=UPI00123BB053|nr:L(+)-tartrate dehydratase subunit alpha [Clostridium sp. HV4-5-A1G]KAA8669669.1 L(+)-tartrate dehydratase subunit alpha [Clostridium sp. HV4-5-A1G]
MEKKEALDRLTDLVSNFTNVVSKRLPDDVTTKLKALSEEETMPMAKMIYKAMAENQKKAGELNRPSCQDTGLIQMFVHVGSKFPYIDDLSKVLKDAVYKATKEAPLRHNTVETFDEVNTGTNTGTRSPWLYWDIIPNSDKLKLDVYMAGGGCSLPGQGKTLMPSEGYEGVVKFVLDIMTSYALNACPPVLVGIGIGTSIDSAAYMSKRALMRPIGSHNSNTKAAQLENELVAAIDSIGLGPQGLRGTKSVMGVNIENSARHPSVISVAVNLGCWAHRRGTIIFNNDLSYEIITHKGAEI